MQLVCTTTGTQQIIYKKQRSLFYRTTGTSPHGAVTEHEVLNNRLRVNFLLQDFAHRHAPMPPLGATKANCIPIVLFHKFNHLGKKLLEAIPTHDSELNLPRPAIQLFEVDIMVRIVDTPAVKGFCGVGWRIFVFSDRVYPQGSV